MQYYEVQYSAVQKCSIFLCSTVQYVTVYNNTKMQYYVVQYSSVYTSHLLQRLCQRWVRKRLDVYYTLHWCVLHTLA